MKECVVCGFEFDADYDDIVCEDCNIRLAIMSEYPDDIPVVAGILEDDDFDPATEAMENYDQDRWDK